MTSAVISNADRGFVLNANLISNLQCLFQVWDIWKLLFKRGCVPGKFNSVSFLWYLFSSALHTPPRARRCSPHPGQAVPRCALLHPAQPGLSSSQKQAAPSRRRRLQNHRTANYQLLRGGVLFYELQISLSYTNREVLVKFPLSSATIGACCNSMNSGQ